MRFAERVDLSLVAAKGELAAELGHLLVVADSFSGLVLLAVDGAETVEEEVAIGLLWIGVLAVGVAGGGEQLLENVECVIVAAERVVDEGFVVAELGGILHERLGFIKGVEGFLVVALATLNLGDADLRLRVLRLGCDDLLEDLEGRVDLLIREQRVGEASLRVDRVLRLLLERGAVGGDGILGRLSWS